MKLRSICIILVIAVSIISCKKFLDKKPDSRQLVPTKLSELQALLDEAGNVMNHQLTPSFGEASSDDYFLPYSIYEARPTREQELYRWVPSAYNYSNDWSKAYASIYHSNYCLETIEKIARDTSNLLAWNNVKGSASFYRAYNFLNLAWNYCKAYDENTSVSDLGIVLRVTTDLNTLSVRSTVKETYEQIVLDIKTSIQLLPLLPSHPYRPSKVSAYGLLARTYLSMRLYDSAFKYSDLYLQNKSDLIDFKNSTDPDLVSSVSSGTSAVFKQFNRETIFYTEINVFTPTIFTSRAKIDTFLFGAYAPTDLRRTAFFRADGSNQRFRGSYAQSTSFFFSGIATDEMYLVKAECLARGIYGSPADKDLALATLNALLQKRHNSQFTGLTASNATQALEIILVERRKELVMRGLRWIDIKRLNKEGRNIILKRNINGQEYSLQPNANYYALPLPTDIINITGMPQNPY